MNQSWICTKCNSMYVSPIRVREVLCNQCSHKAGGRETWMTPSEVYGEKSDRRNGN